RGRPHRGWPPELRPPLLSRPEPDPVLLVVDEHVNDLREIERDRPILGAQLVPPGRAQRVPEPRELRRRDPRAQHLAAVEADADLLGLAARGHAGCSPAGSTISVRTPPVDAGCRNATRDPRIPIRGVSSIKRMPAAASWLSAP